MHPCPNIMFLANLLSSSSVMCIQTAKYGITNIFAFVYANMPKSCHQCRCKMRKVKETFPMIIIFMEDCQEICSICVHFFVYQSSTIKDYFGRISLWIYNLNSKTHFNFAFITETYHLPVEVMENRFKITGTCSEIVVKEQC